MLFSVQRTVVERSVVCKYEPHGRMVSEKVYLGAALSVDAPRLVLWPKEGGSSTSSSSSSS